MSDVLRYSKAEGIDKFILVCLASYAGDDQQAFPSVKTLARDTGLAERTVQRAIPRLIESGELSLVEEGGFKEGKRWANTYRINVHQSHPPVSESHPMGAGESPTPVSESHPNQSLTTNHTTKKHFSLEEAKALRLPESLQMAEFTDRWFNFWLPHRFQHHSGKPSELTISMTIKQCAKWGPAKSCRMIDQAVAGGWQALHDTEQRFSRSTSTLANGETVDSDGFICETTPMGRRRKLGPDGRHYIRAGGQQ